MEQVTIIADELHQKVDSPTDHRISINVPSSSIPACRGTRYGIKDIESRGRVSRLLPVQVQCVLDFVANALFRMLLMRTLVCVLMVLFMHISTAASLSRSH